MIAEALFFVEILRPPCAQKFRDHAVGLPDDGEPGNQRGWISAN
jgi:hypothetical protein